MRARDVMVHNVVTLQPDADIADAVKLLIEHDTVLFRCSIGVDGWWR